MQNDWKDAIAFDAFANDCAEFRDKILPLRETADKGEGSYEGYDLAYNEWLETLHHGIVTHLIATGRIDPIPNRLF